MKRIHSLAIAALLAVDGTAQAQTAPTAAPQSFALEGAIIDSRSSRSLGVVSERGDINALFRAQKAMTFGILRASGISLDQLAPDIRARIERFATTNLEAFRAFSQGLDLKDQGKFVEAKVQFARAAQLDPGFALAVEQQQAMPDVNLGSSVQTRAVLLAAAGTAVDRGKAAFAVDTARAVAALASGQSVILVQLPSNAEPAKVIDYSVNPPGSGTQFLPNIVAGVAYTATPPAGLPVAVATVGEWRAENFRVDGTALESLGNAGNPVAQRGNAQVQPGGSLTLADGNLAHWGAWLSAPGASATVTVNGQNYSAPNLGPVSYVLGDATPVMPTSGTAVFTPGGGSLANVTGNVAVNFVTRDVELRNLGFSIGTQAFTGLNGLAAFDRSIASGGFSGRYSTGQCAGCLQFSAEASTFGGSFLGRNADALAFSTLLETGGGTRAVGIHLFGRQP